mgnify:CR=1 FL=1
MRVFDASSVIHAWDNYPITQFPGLWEWMAKEIEDGEIVMPRVAFEEALSKSPDCGKWLKNHEVVRLELTNDIMQDAVRIKGLIGVVGDQYHPRGVGENDILIIAAARAHGVELVSEESSQPTLPKEPAKRKIPAVCEMVQVAVSCISFIKFIRQSGQVFR